MADETRGIIPGPYKKDPERKQGEKTYMHRAPKFEGKVAELRGHTYDLNDTRQADQYTKTTKEIAEFVGTTYKYGGDAHLAVESLKLANIPLPPDPSPNAGRGEIRLWEK